jgi:hypothetical protein
LAGGNDDDEAEEEMKGRKNIIFLVDSRRGDWFCKSRDEVGKYKNEQILFVE